MNMKALDFSQCQIITPQGQPEQQMFRDLWEIFPYDRPVYDKIMNEGKKLYSVKNYALFQEDNFIGNVGLFALKIWYQGKETDLIGVGAVATMPQFRKQGVARLLMNHCMDEIDRLNLPAILFTELPVVYEKHGFDIIAQEYRAIRTEQINFESSAFDFEYCEALSIERMEQIKGFYNNHYPNYDGKLVRTDEPDYWDYYLMMFNPYMKPRLVLLRDKSSRLCGYCRFEVEQDRLTITELCVGKDDVEGCKGLLSFLERFASLTGYRVLTFAVSPSHIVWNIFAEMNIETFVEPEGVRREIFMSRPAKEPDGKGNAIDFNQFLWSLADKF